MVKVNRRRLWLPLVWPLLALGAGGALAEQVCKYDSIPATAPASRFTDNGDGTVTDQASGLQWKRCSEGQTWNGSTCVGTLNGYTWQKALQHANTATYAGKDDWRLPNIKELASIVEGACSNPAIDLAAFPGTTSNVFLSSSPQHETNGVGEVFFYYGHIGTTNKANPDVVRLVRNGQYLERPLNGTGLDWWADDQSVHLTSEPADYPGQDASYGRDVTQDNDADGHAGFSFTKLDSDGSVLPANAVNRSCVRDNVTGLVWEVKSNDGGLRDRSWTYSWYNPDVSTNRLMVARLVRRIAAIIATTLLVATPPNSSKMST